jgi:hypothetical protein
MGAGRRASATNARIPEGIVGMQPEPLEQVVRNIDVRLTSVEQILPTIATEAEVREEGERTRRHFDIVAERLEGQLRLVAEGLIASGRVDSLRVELKGDIAQLDRRVMRLEATRLS